MDLENPDAAHCAVRLRASVAQLSRRLRPAPQHGGISVAKLSVMGRLYRSGPLTPTALAQSEGVKLQTLTRLLAELEADGWIERKPDAADGRRWLLSLSRGGVRRLSATVQAGEASLAQVIEARLDAAERGRLLQACALLDSIAEALDLAVAAGTAPAQTRQRSGNRPAAITRSSSQATGSR